MESTLQVAQRAVEADVAKNYPLAVALYRQARPTAQHAAWGASGQSHTTFFHLISILSRLLFPHHNRLRASWMVSCHRALAGGLQQSKKASFGSDLRKVGSPRALNQHSRTWYTERAITEAAFVFAQRFVRRRPNTEREGLPFKAWCAPKERSAPLSAAACACMAAQSVWGCCCARLLLLLSYRS